MGVHGTQSMCAFDICSINIVLRECITNKCQFNGVTNMWNSILCLVDESPWHNLSCLKVTCVQCGINMLMTCPIEEDATCSQLLMQWKCCELVLHGKTKSSKDNKVLQLQYKETKPIEFLQCLRLRLQKFIVHNYVAHFKRSSVVATLALGSRPRQRGCKGAGQREARESHQGLPGVQESGKE